MEKLNTNSLLAAAMAAPLSRAEKAEMEPPQDLSQNESDYIDFDGELHFSERRLNDVRNLLRRYRARETSEAENTILAHAMKNLNLSVTDETDKRIFTVLLLSYFHTPTLNAADISKALSIHERTVFKDITKGVSRLCVFIFGITAFTVNERE